MHFELDAVILLLLLWLGVVVAVGHGWLYGGFSLLGFLYSGVKDNNILYYSFYFILPLLGEFGFGNHAAGSYVYICFFRRLPCLFVLPLLSSQTP